MRGLTGEVAVAVLGSDLALVLEADRALAVGLDHGGVADVELGGGVVDQLPWHVQRVGQERAEVTHSEDLQPIAQPAAIRPAPGDQRAILGPEHEAGGQLSSAQLPGEVPVAGPLLGGEELDRHQRPPVL